MSFNPLFSIGVIVVLTIPVFILFAWMELKRKQKFRALRTASVILIFISILGLLARPTLKSRANTDEAILLTPGFDKAKTDSLLKLKPQLKIFRTGSSGEYYYSKIINSQDLMDNNIRYILGEGLSSAELELLDNQSFQFIRCRLPLGVVELNIPKEIFSNQRHSISGIFNSAGKLKLKLIGPAGVEDSLKMEKGINQFSFSFRSKQPGLFVYPLEFEDSIGNKFREKIPLEILPERSLRILFIQKFPNAESRHLKNFLSGKGYSIAMRTQTSKSNFNEEFSNMSKTRLNQLNMELLNSFDMVFLDSKSIAELSSVEKSILKKSIFNGLGLLPFQIEASSKEGFFSVNGKTILTDTVHLQLPGKRYVLPASPIVITEQSSVEPVLKIGKRILSGYKFFGEGKVAFQLLRETYRLGLEGNSDNYAFIWTSLIEKVTRKQNKKFELILNSPFPHYPNEPLDLNIISSGEKPEVFSEDSKMPISENVIIDDCWEGKSWAGKPGWHRFSTNDSTVLNYYVSENNEWRSLRIINQMKETMLTQKAMSSNKGILTSFRFKPISPFIFYLIFLLAAGFLWLAPKI